MSSRVRVLLSKCDLVDVGVPCPSSRAPLQNTVSVASTTSGAGLGERGVANKPRPRLARSTAAGRRPLSPRRTLHAVTRLAQGPAALVVIVRACCPAAQATSFRATAQHGWFVTATTAFPGPPVRAPSTAATSAPAPEWES